MKTNERHPWAGRRIISQSLLFCLLPVIALAGLLMGCSPKAGDEIDFGGFNQSVYTNNFFGLTVTFPADWSIQDQKSRDRLMNLGEKVIAGDDKSMKTIMKAAELQTVNLFVVYQFPLGSPVTNNPAITALAEPVSQLPGIKRGKDYLFHVRQTLESGQLKAAFPKDFYTEQLGGVDFDVMEVGLNIQGLTIKEKYYVTVRKGYALSLIVIFRGDQPDPVEQKILASVTFK
jgi:hypothetical protein